MTKTHPQIVHIFKFEKKKDHQTYQNGLIYQYTIFKSAIDSKTNIFLSKWEIQNN